MEDFAFAETDEVAPVAAPRSGAQLVADREPPVVELTEVLSASRTM
jgi:hypothetical protein